MDFGADPVCVDSNSERYRYWKVDGEYYIELYPNHQRNGHIPLIPDFKIVGRMYPTYR